MQEKPQLRLDWQDVEKLANTVAQALCKDTTGDKKLAFYGVPRGGTYAALALQVAMTRRHRITTIIDSPTRADIYVDDLIDSGNTMRDTISKFGEKPFLVLVNKQDSAQEGTWFSFPWETQLKEDGPQDNIRRILQYIGENVDRDGLKETPDRVVRSYRELFSGYKQDPATIIKTFEHTKCDEMVILKGIECVSMCEHHMMPFYGKAHIAYIPNGRVIGISKLARLLEVFSRRLQIQERLTEQITAALDEHLQPKGSACIIEASHSCMSCRGVLKQNSVMITSSLTGVFRRLSKVRAELMNLIKG